MDKLSMEELGYFLYMQEMERQQAEQEAAQARSLTGDGDDDNDGEDGDRPRCFSKTTVIKYIKRSHKGETL